MDYLELLYRFNSCPQFFFLVIFMLVGYRNCLYENNKGVGGGEGEGIISRGISWEKHGVWVLELMARWTTGEWVPDKLLNGLSGAVKWG